MGGFGSGRSREWSRKAEDHLGVDIRDLQRGGHLNRPGMRTGWGLYAAAGNCLASVDLLVEEERVRFKYRVHNRYRPPDRPSEQKHCVAAIERTPCRFGGARPWFRCPGWSCGRRVTTLYLDGGEVGCRHCHDLRYSSQSETVADRARRRERRIREKLGLGPDLCVPIVNKPRWMRWRTFVRLRDQANSYARVSLADMQRTVPRPFRLDVFKRW